MGGCLNPHLNLPPLFINNACGTRAEPVWAVGVVAGDGTQAHSGTTDRQLSATKVNDVKSRGRCPPPPTPGQWTVRAPNQRPTRPAPDVHATHPTSGRRASALSRCPVPRFSVSPKRPEVEARNAVRPHDVFSLSAATHRPTQRPCNRQILPRRLRRGHGRRRKAPPRRQLLRPPKRDARQIRPRAHAL